MYVANSERSDIVRHRALFSHPPRLNILLRAAASYSPTEYQLAVLLAFVSQKINGLRQRALEEFLEHAFDPLRFTSSIPTSSWTVLTAPAERRPSRHHYSDSSAAATAAAVDCASRCGQGQTDERKDRFCAYFRFQLVQAREPARELLAQSHPRSATRRSNHSFVPVY